MGIHTVNCNSLHNFNKMYISILYFLANHCGVMVENHCGVMVCLG
jgi:hypothetical protein